MTPLTSLGTPLLALPVLLSLVVPSDKTLEETVEVSSAIVVLRRGDRPARTLTIPIEHSKEPFRRIQESWKVTEVLKGDPKLSGQEIWVDVFAWQFNLAMSKEIARGNTVLPSPIFPRYKALAKKPPGPKDPSIHFLNPEGDGAYVPSMMDAVDAIQAAPQIKAAIKAKAK